MNFLGFIMTSYFTSISELEFHVVLLTFERTKKLELEWARIALGTVISLKVLTFEYSHTSTAWLLLKDLLFGKCPGFFLSLMVL